MKTPTRMARICAAAVLAAPLSLLGAMNAEFTKELNLTRYVEPVFPDQVRLDGLAEGQVFLAISCNAAGEPADILVLEASHQLLAESAVQAVREWRFQPSGNPADRKTRLVRIGFRLHGVVVFPFGKIYPAPVLSDANRLKLLSSVDVPSMQSLGQAPKALAQPMPAYPAELAGKGREGSAVVRFYVDEEGRVRLPEVVEASAPEFAAAALAAVTQWRYEPPRKGARTIVASDHWSFKFAAAN